MWSWPKGREDEAKPMEALRDKGVRMLACGDTHTVALATVGWRGIYRYIYLLDLPATLTFAVAHWATMHVVMSR